HSRTWRRLECWSQNCRGPYRQSRQPRPARRRTDTHVNLSARLPAPRARPEPCAPSAPPAPSERWFPSSARVPSAPSSTSSILQERRSLTTKPLNGLTIPRRELADIETKPPF